MIQLFFTSTGAERVATALAKLVLMQVQVQTALSDGHGNPSSTVDERRTLLSEPAQSAAENEMHGGVPEPN
jgi:hypothetical protein